MTAPQAPAAEKAERKAEALPVAETTQAGPVEGLAALGGLGGRMPLTGPQARHLDPARVASLQRSVGNGAVTHLLGRAAVQRAPGGGRPKNALTALMGESDIYAEPVSDVPVESMDYNAVKDEISDIERWIDKQTTSTRAENDRRIRLRQLYARLTELQTPSAPKKGKAAARARATVKRPRSLNEALDVTRMSKPDMADELDTIVAFLRTSPSKADQRKLFTVRQVLEEALAGERVARNEEIRKRDLSIALRPLGGNARDQFEQVVKTIHGIRSAPDNPGVALLDPPGGGMVIPVSLEEAQALKAQAGKMIVRYAGESADLMVTAYEGFFERVMHNRKQWVVHGMVKWATGVDDLDDLEMFGLKENGRALNAVVKQLVKEGSHPQALDKAFALEGFAKHFAEKVGKWEDELVSGAGRWALGLTILKEGLTLLATAGAGGLVSLKVAQGVSAVRAGLTVGGATTLAGGLGAAGGSLADQAISGEGISAGKTLKATAVGAGTGLAIGAAPGAGAVARQGFKVGKAATRTGNVVRAVGAEAVSGTGVNVASAALTGESIPEAIVGGLAGAPISGAGGMAVEHLAKGRKGVAAVGGAVVGSTSATASALAQGKGGAEVGQAAFIGGVGGGLSPHLEQSTIGYHERKAGSAGGAFAGPGDVGVGIGIKPGTPAPAVGADLPATKPVTVEPTPSAAQKPPADAGQPISAVPLPAASPPARPPLGPVDPVASRAIPEGSGRSLQNLVDQYDVVIKVRPMNEESIARLEPTRDPSGGVIEPGAMAKMDIVKAKSLNEFDELIGGPPNSRGLVGLFEPHPPPAGLKPDLHAAAMERYEQRSSEWQSRDADYGQHIKDGIIRVEGGLLLVADPRMAGGPGEKSGKYRKVAGDIDIYDVTHADGTPLTNDQRNEMTTLLRSMGIGVEHGAHEWWGQQSPATYKQDVYEGIRSEHQSKTPLIAYIPVKPPQAVRPDTRISQTPRTSAPGQRITPMRVGAPSSTRLEVAPPPPAGAIGVETVGTVGTARTVGTADTGEPSGSTGGGQRWLGREADSDIPLQPGGPGMAVGRQVRYEQQDKGRYRTVGEPSAGVSESVIVVDTTTGKKHLFKPLGGETAIPVAEARGVTPGHHAPRAKAAEAAAQTLGVDTPGVQLVVINGRKGSLTEWVEGTQSLADFAREKPAEYAAMKRTPEFEQAMASIHALDYLINNLDRVQNLGNYLIELTPDGKFMSLKPIDSELSFTSTRARAIIPQKTSGLPETYSPDMAARIKRLHEDSAAFIDTIRPLVGDRAIPGVMHRLGELYNDAVARGFITVGQAPAPAAPAPPVQRSPRKPRADRPSRTNGPSVGLQRAPATSSAVNAPSRARPVAAQLIAEQYPYLSAEVLSNRQIADVQRFLDQSVRMGGFEPSLREPQGGGSPAFRTLVVPTFALLDEDVRETASWGPEESFKQSLRQTLLKLPVRLEMLPEGPSLKPLFRFVWGPTNKELAERGGRIHYWNLLQDAHWGQQHARIMAGKPKERDPFDELVRSAGGQLLDARGKYVGSYWNGLWTVDIKVGWELGNLAGEPDDPRGHKALLDASRGAGATITLRAPDRRLHRYGLKPSFKHWVLNPDYLRPRGPGNHLYLSDKGTQVADSFEITTEDGETLERVTTGRITGWRVADDGIAPGHLEQFLWGAVVGDYFEDATAASTLGAVVGGVSPLGWIGDARDTYRGVRLILAGEFKEGIIDTAFALLGFIPGAGDYAKKVMKRPTKEAATELANATRKVIEAAEKAAKRTGQSLDDFMSGTKKATAAAPSSLMNAALMRQALDSGTVAEKLKLENLEWSAMIRHFQGQGAHDIVADLQKWRVSKISQIRQEAVRKVLKGKSDVVDASKSTGTNSPLSDVDSHFSGPDASLMKHAMEDLMDDAFGDQWKRVVKADVFTDPKRLHLFDELDASVRSGIEAELVKETGLNAFARMIREGGTASRDRAIRLAQDMGFSKNDVLERLKEVSDLADDLPKIRRLELEVDRLHARFVKTPNPADAKLIAANQSKINAATHGGYVTPGGVSKHVTRKEHIDGVLDRPLSPDMQRMAFIEDVVAMDGAFRALREDAGPDALKDVSKYAERFLRSAGQAGVDADTLKYTFDLWRQFDDLLALARSQPRTVELRQSVSERLRDIPALAKTLEDQLERIAAAVGRSTGGSALAKAIREMARLATSVGIELVQGPGKEKLKEQIQRAPRSHQPNASRHNGRFTNLVQRDPVDSPPKPPPSPKKKPGGGGRPLDIPSNVLLPDVIDRMPTLVRGINGARYKRVKGTARAHGGADEDEQSFEAEVSTITLFARDAIYRFDGGGALVEVESNLSRPATGPDDQPPSKFPLPDTSAVLIAEPKTGNRWQVFLKPNGQLSFEPFLNPISLPTGFASGQVIAFIFAPDSWASEDGGPQPGYKAKPSDDGDPRWAKSQYKEVMKALKKVAGAEQAGSEEAAGAGTGLKGEGPGGGGRAAAGQGTGATGTGSGAATVTAGKGRGGDKRPRDRAKPDKVALWTDNNGSHLNVWVGKSRESIPLKDGEKSEDVVRRVEEAAARQQSTGERLADGATETGSTKSGEGNQKLTDEQLAALGATDLSANAAEYPSTLEMQGGSGAEVSPSGWATTISGGRHNFDMLLDFDARNFGLANQVIARLGYINYFWQVINISDMKVDAAAKTKQEGQEDEKFRQGLMPTAVLAAKDPDKVRKAKWYEGAVDKIGDKWDEKMEGAEKDISEVGWPAKAQAVSLVAIDTVWDMGKTIISAWVSKVTEPENRQEIGFKGPGEYLVRCLANPVPDDRKPYDQQTRRATSVAVFPVRVVNVNARAHEVNQQDKSKLERAQQLVANLKKALDADPSNESIMGALELAQLELTPMQQSYSYSTVQKVAHELQDFDKQITVLEYLSDAKHSVDDIKGPLHDTALEMRREISLSRKRGPNGFVAWYDYEFHLHDVKKARAKKAEQKELAEKKEAAVEPGTSLRPRVAFVSEENGALVKMDMILGHAKRSSEAQSRWVLADVTTKDTARSYDGSSTKTGDEGDAEAVRKAFQAFADKAEYGRGTIAIDIPERPGLVPSDTTMFMTPGSEARWKARLMSLVEIAGMVAPYVKGGQLIGRIAAVGAALDAGAKLYDRAVNDRLQANFETLADVVSMLAPMAHGATALAEKLPMRKGAYVLKGFSKGVDIGNELMMPATFVHDLDKIVRDTSLGDPERRAAIAMLFGRGIRDGVVQYVKVGPGHAYGTELHVPTHEGGAPQTPGAPAAEHVARPEPAGVAPVEGGPMPAPERPTPPDITHKFDTSDTPALAPEPVKGAPRPAQSETPPTGNRIGEPPPADIPAEHLGIKPGSELDTPTDRGKRAEQMRRQAAWQVDAATVEHGTRPDARARARAADFTPMFARWTELKAAGRKAQIENLINAHLAREGIPPVKVEFGAKAPGNAEFAAHEWTIRLSAEAANGDHITAEAFATLIDNAVHETQHTVTTFRGVRIALSTDGYHPQAHIPGKIVGEAIAANDRRPPNKEFDETTRGEALEIYQVQVEPRVEGPMPEGTLDRDAVYARMAAAKDARAGAQALHDYNVGELTKDPSNPDAQRYEVESRAGLQKAENEMIAAHNAYVALPEETFSHRTGGAAKNAVLERLALDSRRNDARREAAAAAANHQYRRRRGDVKGAAEAMKRSQAADRRARDTQTELDGLVSTEPALVGGNVDRRGMPLSAAEIKGAPKAPAKGYAEPGELARRVGQVEPSGGAAARPAAGEPLAAAGPTPAEASPAPGGAKLAPTAEAVETGAEAAKAAARQEQWGGRTIGSDLPSGVVQPSVGTGAQYENRVGRYEIIGKPEGGTSDSQIVKDRTTGELHLFKPKSGEKPVPTAAERGIEPGEYAPRAKASEIATHELGLDTPLVELVRLEGGEGSLTKWIEPKNTAKPEVMSLADYLRPTDKTSDAEADQRLDELKAKPEFQEAWNNIQALDYLINNVDRYQNFGNYMIEFTPAGEFSRLVPIDSELSFTTTEGRAVIEKKTSFLENLTYTQAMADKLRELGRDPQAFADKIRPLVGDAAVNGVLARLADLVADANAKRPAKVPVAAGARP